MLYLNSANSRFHGATGNTNYCGSNAIVVTCILVFDPLDLGFADYLENYGLDSTNIFVRIVMGAVPHFVLGTTRISKKANFHPEKGIPSLFNSKRTLSKISVFKGREAKLNYAIFRSLATEGPQTINDLHKKLSKQKNLEGTYYASLTKRMHCLEAAGYIKQAANTPIQTGFKVTHYELHAKAYLATFLNKTSPETVLDNIDEKNATIVLSDLISTVLANQKQ